MMKFRPAAILRTAIAIFLTVTATTKAYDLPPVNLGFTSFLDGGVPAGPGFYFCQYVQYWYSDEFKNDDGDEIFPPGTDEELNAWISLSQLIYLSDRSVFGAKWGVDVIVPVVSLDLTYDTPNPAFPRDNGGGIGDILVGPFLQWDPVMGEHGPLFVHRLELQITFPTGKYDEDRQLNPGGNIYTINPYWAGTLFITPKWTASTRIHYLWCSENQDTDIQGGQAIHANFATAYEIIPKTLRLGLNGYYLQQITDSERRGKELSGSKERVLGIGPGLLWSLGRENHLFLNAYVETAVKNRPEGIRVNLRWVHHF